MRQQALVIAAAAMLVLGLGIANAASVQTDMNPAVSPEIAVCNSDQNLCVDMEMMNDGNQLSRPDAEAGFHLGQQDAQIDDSDNDAQDQDSEAEQVSADDVPAPELIIIIQ